MELADSVPVQSQCNAQSVAAEHAQALLASGDGNLTYVEIVEGDIQEKAHLKLDSEIACLDLSPLGAIAGFLCCLALHSASRLHAPVMSMVLA